MSRFNHPLDNVRVASPCNADWEEMIGNDRARFCGQCNLNVYNLSSMTKAEAEQLIGSTEGRLCVRYFSRADGSILTDNCPVGLRAVRRRMSYVVRAISSAALSFLAGVGFYGIKSSLTVRDEYLGGSMMGQPVMIGEPVIDVPSPPVAAPDPPPEESYVLGQAFIETPQPKVRKSVRRVRR
jgi:hypothetical protein